MQVIKLNKQTWKINTKARLGIPGGFGEVFRGVGNKGDVAIKRLKVTATEAAHRELKIGKTLSERSFQNIVPVLDYGQDADSDRYFKVMPICDHNLQDEINTEGISPVDAIRITQAILSGLTEVKDITHRDLKPSNILMHESKWKIADFGIAKFVEDSTSLETLRGSLTPAYAAPEQWLLQRPDVATDVYSVGCIVHALITGTPPFTGDVDSLREQHLSSIPSPLKDLPPAIRSIVLQMLRKSPDIRPSIERCISVFQQTLDTDAFGNENTVDTIFAQAVGELATAQAKQEAEQQAREEQKRRRNQIFEEAVQELNQIKQRLFDDIKSQAQDVMEKHSSEERLVVGTAILMFDTSSDSNRIKGIRKSDPNEISSDGGWGVHKRKSEWDIIGFTNISLEQFGTKRDYTRSANLVFGRPNNNLDYRWYEIAFWTFSKNSQLDVPFYLEYVWEIDEALSKTIGINNLAHDPIPIDGEDEGSFINYWKGLVAKAMIGNLKRPPKLPMDR